MVRSSRRLRRFVAFAALFFVAAALAWGNCTATSHFPRIWRFRIEIHLHFFGWPSRYLTQFVQTTHPLSPAEPPVTSVSSEFHSGPFIFNLIVAITMLGATATALKAWLRKARLTQVRLSTVMMLMTVMSVLFALHAARHRVDELVPYHPCGGVWSIPIYVQIPISFGLACVVFVGLSSVVHMIGWIGTVGRRLLLDPWRPSVAQINVGRSDG